MAVAGLYRRVLPSPPAIEFASAEGKQLFAEAIHNETMEGFYKLISYFQTQSEPAYCGLASLSMVLNALAIDPQRKWKGPWRWFDESMLDCCEPLEKVKARGISFGKLVCLAHCAGAKVEAFHTNQSSVDDFRLHVMRCSTSDDCHVISSYHRGILRQTGSGHFSPIGGYHAGRDMALILDVARFKYPPHWVPISLLWEAMNNVDEITGQHRGFMLVSRLDTEPGLLYTLSCSHESWVSFAKHLMDGVPHLLASEDVKTVGDVLRAVFNGVPSNFVDFIKWVVGARRHNEGGDCNDLSLEERGRRLSLKEQVLKQVKKMGLFKHVEAYCRNMHLLGKEEEALSHIVATVCCQGATIFAGQASPRGGGRCCRETRASQPVPAVMLVSGSVADLSVEQGLDVLVPPTHCFGTFLAVADVLTALVLALPRHTWLGIKEEKLLHQIRLLVATETLPVLLRKEVLRLRCQLLLLKKCYEHKADEEQSEPLV